MFKFIVFIALVFSISAIQKPTCDLGVELFKGFFKSSQNGLLKNVCSFVPSVYHQSCQEIVEKSTFESIKNIDSFSFCQKLSQKPKVAELVIKIVDAMKGKDCGVNQIREYYYWLPPSWKEEVKNQLLLVISMQLSRIDFQIVERFVKDLFDEKVPSERVCAEMQRTFLPEWNRRQLCTQTCMDKVDLSLDRILKTVIKCKMDLDCYWQEIQDELMNVQSCSDECYSKPDKVLFK